MLNLTIFACSSAKCRDLVQASCSWNFPWADCIFNVSAHGYDRTCRLADSSCCSFMPSDEQPCRMSKPHVPIGIVHVFKRRPGLKAVVISAEAYLLRSDFAVSTRSEIPRLQRLKTSCHTHPWIDASTTNTYFNKRPRTRMISSLMLESIGCASRVSLLSCAKGTFTSLSTSASII